MSTLPDADDRPPQRFAVRKWRIIVALLMLYAVSIGPAAAVAELCNCGRAAVGVIYYPLGFVADHTGTLPLLRRYARWWMRLAGHSDSA